MLDPGSFSGIVSSPKPDLGPDERNLTSLEILKRTEAKFDKVADNWTKLLISDKATNLSCAGFRVKLKVLFSSLKMLSSFCSFSKANLVKN
jgi:hypothetical protein